MKNRFVIEQNSWVSITTEKLVKELNHIIEA